MNQQCSQNDPSLDENNTDSRKHNSYTMFRSIQHEHHTISPQEQHFPSIHRMNSFDMDEDCFNTRLPSTPTYDAEELCHTPVSNTINYYAHPPQLLRKDPVTMEDQLLQSAPLLRLDLEDEDMDTELSVSANMKVFLPFLGRPRGLGRSFSSSSL